ncbi:MAG: hypothetical protein ACYTGG_07840 [Planctomycetota bacterium]
MRNVLTTVLVAASVLVVAAPAAGQSLSDRIAEIRRQEARGQQYPQRKLTQRGRILQALLHTPVTVSFDQTPAREAFKFLGTVLDVNIVARYLDDNAGHGIDPDTPITLEMEDASAIDVLEMILEQCSSLEDCTWQLRKSFLEVGTKARLSVPAARSLKIYPIDDLLITIPSFHGAPDMRLDGDYMWYWRDGQAYGGWPGRYQPGGFRAGYTGFGGGSGGAGGSINLGGASRGGQPQTQAEKAEEVIDMIVGAVEPNAWTRHGGEWATINYREGSLLVNAPDYIHRQIGGYPSVPPPRPAAAPTTSPGTARR